MAGNGSPFGGVPASSQTEPSSGYTYEGQLERVGELATGLRSRPRGVQLAVRIVVLVMLAALLLAAMVPVALIVYRSVA